MGAGRAKMEKMDKIKYIYGLSYGSHLKTNYFDIMYHQSDGTDVTKLSKSQFRALPVSKMVKKHEKMT